MAISYPLEGRNYLVSVALGNQAKINDWYIMAFEGDYTPKEDDKASNIVGRATEMTGYAETTRPLFQKSGVSGGSVNNLSNVAVMTLSAAKTIRGFAIMSSATKGSAAGILLAIERLPAPRNYAAGDVIRIPISLTAQNV